MSYIKLYPVNICFSGYQQAGEELIEATKEAFQPGARLVVTVGKSRFEAEVVSAGGFWWSGPDQVVVRNLSTGNLRKIFAHDKHHDIVFL